VIHPTYRSLDAPVKLVGFTLRQWAAVIVGATLVIAVVVAASLPTKVAISLCVLLIGVPVALTYVSETGGLALATLLRDCIAWRARGREFPADAPADARAPGLLISQPPTNAGAVRSAEEPGA
jgi:hypothetical protein